MTLRDLIANDSAAVFLNASDFAEAVTYYPTAYPGQPIRSPRAITAVVEREQITVVREDGDTVAPVWRVHIANDSVTGISSTELNLGGDQIMLAPRDGKTPERRTIVELVEQDHAMLVVQCQ